MGLRDNFYFYRQLENFNFSPNKFNKNKYVNNFQLDSYILFYINELNKSTNLLIRTSYPYRYYENAKWTSKTQIGNFTGTRKTDCAFEHLLARKKRLVFIFIVSSHFNNDEIFENLK